MERCKADDRSVIKKEREREAKKEASAIKRSVKRPHSFYNEKMKNV